MAAQINQRGGSQEVILEVTAGTGEVTTFLYLSHQHQLCSQISLLLDM